MAPQSFKLYVPRGSTDNSVNASSLPSFTVLKRSPALLSLLLKKQPGISLELSFKIPPEPAKVPRSSQSIQQSELSGNDADGREMSPDQAPVLPQKTDRDGHCQEFSQDVHPRQDLQTHPKLRSSPQAGLEIMADFRLARPRLQRQICKNDQDHVTAGQKILLPLHQHGRQRMIPEAPEENQVRTERSHQTDQKEYRRYLSLPSGRQVLADERPLKPSDMNVPRPMIRSPLTTPYHFEMPSQNCQLMVSPIAYSAKSCSTGNLSSVNPQDQRNHVDFIEQEVMPQGNLGQPECCCPTYAADGKLENEPSRPAPKDLRPHILRLKRVSSAQLQQCLEQYLDRWATEPTFVEEVSLIAKTLLEKDLVLSSQLSGHLNNGTSYQGDLQFHDFAPQANSASQPASFPQWEYTPQYSPISP